MTHTEQDVLGMLNVLKRLPTESDGETTVAEQTRQLQQHVSEFAKGMNGIVVPVTTEGLTGSGLPAWMKNMLQAELQRPSLHTPHTLAILTKSGATNTVEVAVLGSGHTHESGVLLGSGSAIEIRIHTDNLPDGAIGEAAIQLFNELNHGSDFDRQQHHLSLARQIMVFALEQTIGFSAGASNAAAQPHA